MSQEQAVSGTKSVRQKAKPSFGRQKATRVDLYFDKQPTSFHRPAVAYSPGFSKRYVIPCRVGESGRIDASLSQLCGFLRNGKATVIGKQKTVEMDIIVRGKKRRVTREVIDLGKDHEIVVFADMKTPHCWAYRSQVVSGL